MTPESSAPLPLSHLRIQGFQSLHDVTLPLAPYTVIVGPSSSGKSALVRALKTLLFNARGTSYVTQGFRRTILQAVTPTGTVQLTRSPHVSKPEDNAYVIDYGDPNALPITFTSDAARRPTTFTKLAGDVPPEVAHTLNIPRDPALVFASQFDKPYLLDSPPTEVARTLAALTNVHVILAAAREANRRRLVQAQTLRLRRDDLALITARHEEFAALARRRQALAGATESLERAHAAQERVRTLTALITAVQKADSALVDALAQREVTVQVPDLADAETIVTRIDTLAALIDGIAHASATAESARQAAEEAAHRARHLQEEYVAALSLAGTCPTCGQAVHEVDLAHVLS